MSNNVPPAPSGNDPMYAVMQKLFDDSRRVKSAHFIAAQRKRRNARIIGVLVIVLNVLIGSGLIEGLAQIMPRARDGVGVTPQTVIKGLAFLAAALAGIQTYFNFQKEVDCHTTSGDIYGNINRRLGDVMAKYLSKPAERDALITQYEALRDRYLKANDDGKACVPSDSDYDKARMGIEGRRGGKRMR